MSELNDIKAGDKVLLNFNTGGYSPKEFNLPKEVKRTNKTQIVLVNEHGKEVKYKRDTGYEIGQGSLSWRVPRRISPYTVDGDDTKRFEDYKMRQSMEMECHKLLDLTKTKVKSLGNHHLGSLVDLLKNINKQ